METPSSPPLPPGKRKAYYCLDGENVLGPETIDEIALAVKEGHLPATMSVQLMDTNEWIAFSKIPDSWLSPQVTEALYAQAKAINSEIDKKKNSGCAAAVVLVIFCVGLYVLLTVLFG